MKKALKRSFSILLAITIIFSSAYVGLSEVDFKGFSEFIKESTPDFFVKSKAAASGTCGDNLTWTLDDEGTLTISGTGKMYNYSSYSSIPWYSLLTNVKTVVINNGVTSICDTAFAFCTNLISINIPVSLTCIGVHAFSDCTSLMNVYITDLAAWCGIKFYDLYSNPLYYAKNLYINGELVTDVIIPDGVTTVPVYAFSCENVVSITIPDSVTSIGSCAFEDCTSLTSIAIPNSVISIGWYAFSGCTSLTSITIPDNVTSIGAYVFEDCTRLTAITIPDSVTSIGAYAFEDCTSLADVYYGGTEDSWKNITIGSANTYLTNATIHFVEEPVPDCLTFELNEDGESYSVTDCDTSTNGELIIPSTYNDLPVTKVGDDAFYECTSLTSITIPDSVTSIGNGAFYGCTSLASITFPDSVTSIGNYAFFNCTSLTSVAIGDSLASIGDYVFYNTGYYNNSNNWENDVLYIGNHLIAVNASITGAYEIKNGTKCISVAAFYNCTSLTSITIPDSVTSIDDGTFSECTSLASITIPDSVTYIGYAAFFNCDDIKNVFYGGNQSKWASMYVSSGNTHLTNKRIHYNVDVADWENHCTKPVVTKKPTCTSNGTKTYSCPCGYDVTETIYSLGHQYPDEWQTQAPSCENSGYDYKECTVCGDKTDITTIPATGHTAGVWIIDQNATVNAKGSKHKECTVCGVTVETAAIPQLKPATPKLTSVINITSGVKFTWGKVTGADSYIVYRRTYNASTKKWSGWANLGKVTATSFVDKTAKSGTYYIYTVRAGNEAGYSGYNATGFKTYFLELPTLTSVTNSSTGVTVKWNKVAGATNYVVYRRAYNSTTKKWSGWTNIAKGVKTTSYTDTSAKSGTYYIYTAKAAAGTYISSYNATGLKTYFLSAPALSSATSTTSGVKFTWGKVTGASGYIVYRRVYNPTTKTWGGWSRLATVTGNTNVTYVDASAQKGTYYIYTTKAYYGSYTSYYNTTGLKVKDIY